MHFVKRLALAAAFPLAACATAPAAPAAPAAAPAAKALVESRSGSTVTGTALFTPVEGGVRVQLSVEGAAPGEHGVHLHEKGDCTDPKAASAGGHFNPGGMHHGGLTTGERHGGDFGNLVAGADGKGSIDVVAKGLSLEGAADGVVGKAIVVHEKTDDQKTDPSGNSGARVGCGVVAK
jgi:superoxide dismutase, Cu-Zn family